MEQIYLSPPHMSGHEVERVMEAFASNWIAPLGPQVDAFEKEFAQYVGSKGALALNSGTAAVHLGLRLLGVQKDDLVFCSTLTFVASANPILYLGATPVFIDSEPDSWNMAPEALERAFVDAKLQGKLPKAVIVVNLYGQSADMMRIAEICERYEVPIVEDAAESLGATYMGRSSGTFGKYGVFSFNGNKIITTSGGGMLVSDDLDALDKARYWSTQARQPVLHYEHTEMGYNYRLSNLLAAVGRGQLQIIEDRIRARRTIYQRYQDQLAELPGVLFMPEATYGRSTRWLSVMTVQPMVSGVDATMILQCLHQEKIEARPVWKPLHRQPLFEGNLYYSFDGVNSISDQLFQNGICLPSGSNLTEIEQMRVIETIKKLFQEVG